MAIRLRPSTCHPEKRDYARGLCVTCYTRAYRARRDRGRVYNRIVVPDEPIPALPLRIVQRNRSTTFTVWPRACPHCHATTALLRDGRALHCAGWRAGCGWIGYLVRVEEEVLCGVSASA